MLNSLTRNDLPDSIKDVVDVIDIDAFKGSYRDISMKYRISEVQARDIINKQDNINM